MKYTCLISPFFGNKRVDKHVDNEQGQTSSAFHGAFLCAPARNKKTKPMKQITGKWFNDNIIRHEVLILMLLMMYAVKAGWGQTQLSLWNFEDVVSPTDVAANMEAGEVTISAGSIGFQNGTDDGGTRIGNSGNWNQSGFSTTEKHLAFSFGPVHGYGITLSSITLRFGRTDAGPQKVTVQVSLDGFSTAGITILDGADVTSTDANSLDLFTASDGLPESVVTSAVTVRIWGHHASGTGNLRFNNFRVYGTVEPTGDPRAATPTFSPPGGTYPTTQHVDMASATPGATVYFSLTGEMGPWTPYTEPVSVGETTTIWAYAAKEDMDDSAVASATYTLPVFKKWSGDATTSNWTDADNWSPAGTPGVSDHVVLDNSIVTNDYTVDLPDGSAGTEIATLHITPEAGKAITLHLPAGNTANPGLRISGPGDALVIDEGGVFRNATGASVGSGFELTGGGAHIRINNGGRYIHQTTRAHATAIVAKLSTATGTEHGVFEFDVPGAAAFSPSTSNRTYGTLVLSALTAGNRTYSMSGMSPLTVRGGLIIGDHVSLQSDMSGEMVVEGDFVVSATGSALLGPQSTVTIHGTLTNNAGAAGLVLEPGASLLHNTAGVEATVKQSVATGGTWGPADKSGTVWNWISSPVAGQSIAGMIETFTGDYDLYRWSEADDTWLNHKSTVPPLFAHNQLVVGTGYLFGAEKEEELSHEGTLFVENHTWSSLTHDGTGIPDANDPNYYLPGWHLLGNPYASGVVFRTAGTGQWTGTHVALTPQRWDDSGASYRAIAENEYMPQAQAFFIRTTAPGAQLHIPANARAHSAPDTKNEQHHRILLTARPVEGNTWQQSVVRLEPDANEQFDCRYHAFFRPGFAPQFYAVMDGNRLLVYAVREIHNDLTIPFAFIKNDEGNDFLIELLETIPHTTPILADLKTGTVHELTPNSPYTFTAEENDDPMRFELRFGQTEDPTSITTPAQQQTATIYTRKNTLHINLNEATTGNRIDVYDTSGRLLIQQQLGQGTHHQKPLSLQTGIYVVRLISPQHIQTERVFVP